MVHYQTKTLHYAMLCHELSLQETRHVYVL